MAAKNACKYGIAGQATISLNVTFNGQKLAMAGTLHAYIVTRDVVASVTVIASWILDAHVAFKIQHRGRSSFRSNAHVRAGNHSCKNKHAFSRRQTGGTLRVSILPLPPIKEDIRMQSGTRAAARIMRRLREPDNASPTGIRSCCHSNQKYQQGE